MNLQYILDNLDKSRNNSSSIAWETLHQLFKLPIANWYNQSRITSYYISNWICTDTVIGNKAYFFDGVPFAISFQKYRKSDEVFKFITGFDTDIIRDYLISLVESPEYEVSYTNLDAEYGSGQPLEYSESIMAFKIYYNGILCDVIGKYNIYGSECRLVDIKYPNGEVSTVELNKCLVPYNLKI